jgi:nitrilase
MKAALCQIAPVLLDRAATLDKVAGVIRDAASQGATLACFGEIVVPGYPLWLERTDGARFDSDLQKQIHARYLREAVCIEAGDLEPAQDAARDAKCWVVLGVAERPRDRGGHTIYCSRIVIDDRGRIASVHRKLMPTYEERLAWGVGDGHGLVVHEVGGFTLGALNCWENWMPLARAALYAQGETLHVAIWPGGEHNTREITRFIARESRSYVLSASAIVRARDIPADFPARDRIVQSEDEVILNGGSAAAGPNGEWLLEPQAGEEGVFVIDLDPDFVRRERQNFDPSGHYARPDVLRLTVDRRRQRPVDFID